MNNSYRFRRSLVVSTVMSSLFFCNSAEAMLRGAGSALKPAARSFFGASTKSPLKTHSFSSSMRRNILRTTGSVSFDFGSSSSETFGDHSSLSPEPLAIPLTSEPLTSKPLVPKSFFGSPVSNLSSLLHPKLPYFSAKEESQKLKDLVIIKDDAALPIPASALDFIFNPISLFPPLPVKKVSEPSFASGLEDSVTIVKSLIPDAESFLTLSSQAIER